MSNINNYQVGMVVYGRVSGIKPYGAFIQLNDGINGLIHISEISSNFVRNISQFIKLDSYVMAKIIDIDYKHKQLRLSYKALHKKRKNNDQANAKMIINHKGFSSLEKQLPIWIKEFKPLDL